MNKNIEKYKNEINDKNAKFMIFDGENSKTLTTDEMLHQLMLDNKYLEMHIYNLQSKIDKAIEILERDYWIETHDRDLYEVLKEDKQYEY